MGQLLPCGTVFNAPIDPATAGKVHHLWRCDRPAGHAGPHDQTFPSASINVQTRLARFAASAVITDHEQELAGIDAIADRI